MRMTIESILWSTENDITGPGMDTLTTSGSAIGLAMRPVSNTKSDESRDILKSVQQRRKYFTKPIISCPSI